MGQEADRDIGHFDRWATEYDRDRLQQRFFGPVHGQVVALLAGLGLRPGRVLDIGCGTGALLRRLSGQFPGAALAGVDPAAGMIGAARRADVPAGLARADAVALPFADESFDLVASTVSFHHWSDQRAGLAEAGRVLAPGGVFLLADLHAVGYLRAFYTLARRRHRMHTRDEITRMLDGAGLQVQDWVPVFDLDPLLPLRARRPRPPTGKVPLVTAVIARRPERLEGSRHCTGGARALCARWRVHLNSRGKLWLQALSLCRTFPSCSPWCRDRSSWLLQSAHGTGQAHVTAVAGRVARTGTVTG